MDQLVGKQEVVIKSLGPAFAGLRGVAGGAILGDGRIGLILDAGGVIGLAEHGSAQAAQDERPGRGWSNDMSEARAMEQDSKTSDLQKALAGKISDVRAGG